MACLKESISVLIKYSLSPQLDADRERRLWVQTAGLGRRVAAGTFQAGSSSGMMGC